MFFKMIQYSIAAVVGVLVSCLCAIFIFSCITVLSEHKAKPKAYTVAGDF